MKRHRTAVTRRSPDCAVALLQLSPEQHADLTLWRAQYMTRFARWYLLGRLVEHARAAGDKEIARERGKERERWLQKTDYAKSKLVPLLGADAVNALKAWLFSNPRALEVLGRADATMAARFTEVLIDGDEWIRAERITDRFLANQARGTWATIGVALAEIDQSIIEGDGERGSKGQRMLIEGQRELRKICSDAKASARTAPTAIEAFLARGPTGATQSHEDARTGEHSTIEPNATHNAAQGDEQGTDAEPIEIDPTGDAPPPSGISPRAAGGGVADADRFNFSNEKPFDSSVTLDRVLARVRVGGAPAVTTKPSPVREVITAEPEPHSRLKPRRLEDIDVATPRPKQLAAPIYSAQLGRFVSADEMPVRSAVGGPPPHARAELERLAAEIAATKKEKKL